MATNEKKKKTAPDAAETTQDAAQANAKTVEQQDTDTAVDATADASEEATQTDTAAMPEAETKPETAPEELQEVARSLMREHGVSQVYRCPINGYWFIREEYVKEYVAESGNEVETYTNEVKVEDHDA